MTTETVFVGKDKLKIETAPITLIFNSAPDDMFYPDRVMIDPEMTAAHFQTMPEINPFVAGFFKLVVNDYPDTITIENIQKSVPAFKHIVALFDLSLQFLLQNRPFGWKYPEAYLHPRYQGNLADALITFSDKTKFIQFIEKIKKSL